MTAAARSALGDLLAHAVAGASMAEQAQLALGRLGDERLLTAVPDPDPTALAALAAHTHRPDHQRLALSHPAARPDELLTRLTSDSARTLWPGLKDLLRCRPTPALACRFGDWGIQDPELLGLLETTVRSDDAELATAAAVSAASLGADPDSALRLLESRLGDNGWCLEGAGRLGRAAAPLLPLVEGYLADGDAWTRMRAAETHWRITGDASKAVPILTALAGPLPLGVRALQTLLLIGPPFPPHLQPHLRHWATAERHLVSLRPGLSGYRTAHHGQPTPRGCTPDARVTRAQQQRQRSWPAWREIRAVKRHRVRGPSTSTWRAPARGIPQRRGRCGTTCASRSPS